VISNLFATICSPVDVIVDRKVNALQPNLFKDYGGKLRFSGQV
jgi:hypothetical protein